MTYFFAILFWAATAGRLCGEAVNPIDKENTLQGVHRREWDVNGAGDPSIQGFSTDISYNAGGIAQFKINSTASRMSIHIFRMGYYDGLGARLVATISPHHPAPYLQPPCDSDEGTGLYDCGQWTVTAAWAIPSSAVSGVYIARLVNHDPPTTWRADHSSAGDDPRFAMPGGASMRKPKARPHAYGALGYGALRDPLVEPRASLIYFVVRNDGRRADVIVQTADTVWQAYNNEGGRSTYGSIDPAHPRPRCYKSSLNRPLHTRAVRPVNAFLGSEFPIVRFLEANGYDIKYMTGVDVDRYGEELRTAKAFISMGHDEYWSGRQRENVVGARDKGIHLLFLSANEMYWRIRWEDNYRTMVCYKESQSLVKIDPNLEEWTGTFRDSRSINPLGAQPENEVTGTIFTINAWRNDPLIVPARYGKFRQWRNTSVAKLRPGERAILFRGVLGHEIDEDIDNGFRPEGLIRLSETPIDNAMYIMDFGSTFDSGSGTHHLVMYRAASGALVFGAGTVQWGWALDGFHDSESGVPAPVVNHMNIRVGMDPLAPDADVVQFTVNVLGDMGIAPATPQGGVVVSGPSNDVEAPRCTVGRNATHAVIATTDDDVAAVEFRTVGRWRPAVGGDGRWFAPADISEARAIDDSFNVGNCAEVPLEVILMSREEL